MRVRSRLVMLRVQVCQPGFAGASIPEGAPKALGAASADQGASGYGQEKGPQCGPIINPDLQVVDA